MTTQANLFGGVTPTQRLFFALLPDSATRDVISRTVTHAHADLQRMRATPAHRLHVTLVYLGESAGPRQDWISAARRAADSIQTQAFEMTFDRIDGFRGQPAPCVLLGDTDSNVALYAFQQQVRDACRRHGLRDAGHAAFRPHVTLGRSPEARDAPVRVAPICWPTHAFSLLHSSPGRAEYERLGTWPLG